MPPAARRLARRAARGPARGGPPPRPRGPALRDHRPRPLDLTRRDPPTRQPRPRRPSAASLVRRDAMTPDPRAGTRAGSGDRPPDRRVAPRRLPRARPRRRRARRALPARRARPRRRAAARSRPPRWPRRGVIPIGAPVKNPDDLPSPGPGVAQRHGPARLARRSCRCASPTRPAARRGGCGVTSTTRGTGCLQVGRVVGGRLGALGDRPRVRRRRALPPVRGAVRRQRRVRPARRGQAPVPDAGAAAACPRPAPPQNGACVPPGEIIGDPTFHDCAPADLRDLVYGTLGPHARSITYNEGGRHAGRPSRSRARGARTCSSCPGAGTLGGGISGSL